MSSASSGDFFAVDHLALKLKMVTAAQLAECQEYINAASRAGADAPPLERVLVERGYLLSNDLDALKALCERYRHSLSGAGYEILDKLGQGAMGTVYRARHLPTGKIVAVKILSESISADPMYLERFRREAEAAVSLHHDNIVAGIEYGEANGIHFFVMEHVDGAPLGKLLREQGKIDEETALQIVHQVAQALKYAAEEGVIHRDVKPDNIMLAKDGAAKLCDLGLAKRTSGEATLTQSGFSVGTPYYISPEQAMGLREIDIRSDIYSLGATLFHAVCGQAPFTGSSPALVMTRHINDALPDPRALNENLRPATALLIRKMMAKEPGARHDSPRELIADIERIWNGGTVELKEPCGPWGSAGGAGSGSIYSRATVAMPGIRRWAASPRAVVGAAAALLLLAVAAVVFADAIKAALGISPVATPAPLLAPGPVASDGGSPAASGPVSGAAAPALPWGNLSEEERRAYLRMLAQDPQFRKELLDEKAIDEQEIDAPAPAGADADADAGAAGERGGAGGGAAQQVDLDKTLKMVIETLRQSRVLPDSIESRAPTQKEAEAAVDTLGRAFQKLQEQLDRGGRDGEPETQASGGEQPVPKEESRLSGVAAGGVTVYRYDDLAAELRLSTEKKEKIAAILAGGREEMKQLMVRPGKDGRSLMGRMVHRWITRSDEMAKAESAEQLAKVLDMENSEYFQNLSRVHQDTQARIAAELSPAQRRRYEELIDDPFVQIRTSDGPDPADMFPRRERRPPPPGAESSPPPGQPGAGLGRGPGGDRRAEGEHRAPRPAPLPGEAVRPAERRSGGEHRSRDRDRDRDPAGDRGDF